MVYNQAMEYGWRRSGIQMYKPNNWKSCCPTYPIRLSVHQSILSHSQRKIHKRMKQLLQGIVVGVVVPTKAHQHQPQQEEGQLEEEGFYVVDQNESSFRFIGCRGTIFW